MSNIAQEKAPPGSWPCNKGELGDTDQTQNPMEPRSPPAVPEYEGFNVGGSGEWSQSGDYTHREPQAKAPEELRGREAGEQQEGEQEEGEKEEGEQQQEPIKMKDVEPQPISEHEENKPEERGGQGEEEKKTVQEGDSAAGVEQQSEQQEPEVKTGDDAEAPAEAAIDSSLTEKAKQAFDQASENQPTNAARDSFLQAARNKLLIPKFGSPRAQVEEEQKAPEAEVSETAGVVPAETQEEVRTEREEEQKAPEAVVLPAETQEEVQAEKEGEMPTTEDKAAGVLPAEIQEEVQAEVSEAAVDLPAETQEVQTEEEEQKAPEAEASEAAGVLPAETQEEVQVEKEEEQKAPDVEEEVQAEKEEQMPITEEEAALEPQEQPAEGETEPAAEALEEAQLTAEEAAAAEEEQAPPDLSILKDGTVNKSGNVVSRDGTVVGRVVEGEVKHLVGKHVDENGVIWSSGGKAVGRAEVIPDSERDEMLRETAPFENFPDAVVDKGGMVMAGGEIVGRVVEGELRVLRGRAVDPDGDILDKVGNVIEPEPEPEVDKSVLAGKRVNKVGNVVDGNGVIFGRIVEGDVKRMVGRMCDKNGNVLSESGDILGRAELVTEGEREGLKEGPFAELQGCTVAKDGTIVTPAGDIVGRLISGDGKILFGRTVDEDGDILDKNGNTVGKAERWEPEPVERKKNPMSGRRVNREGNVLDEDGNLIGKLTSGTLTVCSGKDIDDDGDVVDYKGNVVGHCSLLEDIPEEPKEEESPEEKEKREQAEKDKKLAIQMSACIEQCLDSIRPICKLITEKIDKAESTPEDERDEEALVQEVRPLIEEGGRILNEAKGIIKGLDPDGRISANAKHKTAAREATPEEYHLAEVLKDLTGDVTQCIDNARRKLEDMPHAKKELNPLWGLLNEPLFQILAAVGLLLAGVLNLVGRLLGGLGLGGLVDGLLGTLGITRVLEGLGLGSFSKALKGGKKGGGKKGGGGLLSGVLGG
ncbi:hypothetical protein B0I37DRAFT_390031 [Chaetomium sp. MPI-CAGE-AT-0009]|nr:hypothetical protein B0I37DRAFT_390031 [Chaetomium sp. MPI-CAGE-AT-0009]